MPLLSSASRTGLVALIAAIGLAPVVGGCSSSPSLNGTGGNVGAGGGGHSGSGGTTGSGGQGGTAGDAGTAGAGGKTLPPGGTTGMAGATGTGGITGTGGATAGTTGTAGTSGRVPTKHRAAAIACSMDRPASACLWTSMPDAGVVFMCMHDSDCAEGSNGRCDPMIRSNGCTCSYDQCVTDADCKTTGPCECRPAVITAGQGAGPTQTPINSCKAGNCRVDKDCGGGAGYCSPTLGPCGTYGGLVGYYCHTPQDKCTDDADCAAQGGGDCRYDQVSAAWTCQKGQCAG